MKYWERYILVLLFITAIPSIIYESLKYYPEENYNSFFQWFMVNLEYEWNCLKNGHIN